MLGPYFEGVWSISLKHSSYLLLANPVIYYENRSIISSFTPPSPPPPPSGQDHAMLWLHRRGDTFFSCSVPPWSRPCKKIIDIKNRVCRTCSFCTRTLLPPGKNCFIFVFLSSLNVISIKVSLCVCYAQNFIFDNS